MALYPHTVLDGLVDGLHDLAPSAAICIPLALASGQSYAIDVVRTSTKTAQDWTIRAWISREALGNPDAALPVHAQTWQPNGAPNTIVFAFHDRVHKGDGIFDIPADPGFYFLNVLNLSNTPNQFSLTVTDTTATSHPA